MTADIRDNKELSRYETIVDGHLGAAYYERAPGTITFTHTDVAPELGGRGIGSLLAKFALDRAREDGDKVVALCPFIARYIERHPEYRDLLKPGAPRGRVKT
jgi:predicted GNAT family acetyltransferase